jgi:hypothetical protein
MVGQDDSFCRIEIWQSKIPVSPGHDAFSRWAIGLLFLSRQVQLDINQINSVIISGHFARTWHDDFSRWAIIAMLLLDASLISRHQPN